MGGRIDEFGGLGKSEKVCFVEGLFAKWHYDPYIRSENSQILEGIRVR